MNMSLKEFRWNGMRHIDLDPYFSPHPPLLLFPPVVSGLATPWLRQWVKQLKDEVPLTQLEVVASPRAPGTFCPFGWAWSTVWCCETQVSQCLGGWHGQAGLLCLEPLGLPGDTMTPVSGAEPFKILPYSPSSVETILLLVVKSLSLKPTQGPWEGVKGQKLCILASL